MISSSAYRNMLKSFETLEKDIASGADENRVTRNAARVESRIEKLTKKFPDLDVSSLVSRLEHLTNGGAATVISDVGLTTDTEEDGYFAQKQAQLDGILNTTGFASNPSDVLADVERRIEDLDLATLRQRTADAPSDPEADQMQQSLAALEGRLVQSPLITDARQVLVSAQASLQAGDVTRASENLNAVGGLFAVFNDMSPNSAQLQQMTMMHQQMAQMLQQMAPELANTAQSSGDGPVVFTSRPLDGAEETVEGQSQFDNEAIYATLYLSKQIRQLNGDGLFILNAQIGNGSPERFELYVPEANLQDSVLDFPISPFPSWFETKGPTLGKGQVAFLYWLNDALSAADRGGDQTISLSFLRLGGPANEIRTAFEITGTDREFYRQAALSADDVLNADNTLFFVGQKAPDIEAQFKTVAEASDRFSDLEIERVLLWDRSWERSYAPDRKTISGRTMRAGLVGVDKDARYQLVMVDFGQEIDTPTEEIYNPDELVDALFQQHPLKVVSVARERKSLSKTAALAEVEVRQVITVSPVIIHNTLRVPVRVDSGGQKQTFPPGKRGSFNYEVGMPVAIRDQGSRLIKMVREDEFQQTGVIIVP